MLSVKGQAQDCAESKLSFPQKLLTSCLIVTTYKSKQIKLTEVVVQYCFKNEHRY